MGKEDVYTKDSIRTRIFRHIATLWPDVNIRSADPLLMLLVEGLAGEIFRLSGEMHDTENHILEKMAMALTPDVNLSASPAHAILHAPALEGCMTIGEDAEFLYRNEQVLKKNNLKRLVFSPACSAEVIHGDLLYIADVHDFCRITPFGTRECIARSHRRGSADNRRIYLGIRIGVDVAELRQLTVYFDLHHCENKERYLPLMALAKWQAGEHNLKVSPGIPFAAKNDLLRDCCDTALQMRREVVARYDMHFVTIQSQDDLRKYCYEPMPEVLREAFGIDFTEAYTEPLLWLAIDLPPLFMPEVVQELVATVNAFPVVNLFRTEIRRQADVFSSIIPLEKADTEYLVNVCSVSDPSGREYREVRIPGDEAPGVATYALRRNGCERFNTQDANSLILRLTDLLYEESAAFAGLGQEVVKENIRQILYHTTLLKKKLPDTSRNTEMYSYVMLSVAEDDAAGQVRVTYMLTCGPYANDLTPGEQFRTKSGTGTDDATTSLLTPTRGGRPEPTTSQKADSYKFSLLSHGSVYTREDICNFCLSAFGEYISELEVATVYGVSARPREGFIRQLEIRITPSSRFTEGMRPDLLADIAGCLKARSPENFNYRIIINE